MTQSTLTAGNATIGGSLSGGNDGTFSITVGPAGSQVMALSASATGAISLAGQVVSASTTNTVTNKVAIVINGTTYYLLASTSGT